MTNDNLYVTVRVDFQSNSSFVLHIFYNYKIYRGLIYCVSRIVKLIKGHLQFSMIDLFLYDWDVWCLVGWIYVQALIFLNKILITKISKWKVKSWLNWYTCEESWRYLHCCWKGDKIFFDIPRNIFIFLFVNNFQALMLWRT